MTTSLNSSLPARDANYQLVHYLRKTVTFNDGTNVVTVGVMPSGAMVVGGGVHVSTNFGGTATVNVGYAADSLSTSDPDAYASSLAIGTTAGFVALDELANASASAKPRSVDTTVTATMAGATGTTGSMDVIVTYIPNNPAA